MSISERHVKDFHDQITALVKQLYLTEEELKGVGKEDIQQFATAFAEEYVKLFKEYEQAKAEYWKRFKAMPSILGKKNPATQDQEGAE